MGKYLLLTLVAELIKWSPQVPTETRSKDENLADRVPRCKAKVDNGKYDRVELEEWARGIEKMFIVVEVLEERKVNIGTYCLTVKADMV